MKRLIARMKPNSMAGQLILILTVSFSILLIVFTVQEILENQDDIIEWAESRRTLSRIDRVKTVLDQLPIEGYSDLFRITGSCHSGYAITDDPMPVYATTTETDDLRKNVASYLGMDISEVNSGYTTVTRENFTFRDCGFTEERLPIEGIVISIKLKSGQWYNKEVHHHWHVEYMIDWLSRAVLAFLLIGFLAVLFIKRVTKPLDKLTDAAITFGDGLKVSKIDENAPPDLKRTIQAFNAMQQQVADEVKKRTDTLASISHDVRTPLTALRIKAELIEDEETKQDLIASVEKMEKITASALEFLRGESRGEPKREIDVSALLESECHDFEELGHAVTFKGETNIHHSCRPEALARAVRNLIENAIKYGGGAEVSIQREDNATVIAVADNGPGIPEDMIETALQPFERLSKARESEQGGFGLGLSVAKAIAEGHDGELILKANTPNGLVATIRLPVTA